MPELRKGYRVNHKGTLCPIRFMEREEVVCQESYCDECWVARSEEHPELKPPADPRQVRLV